MPEVSIWSRERNTAMKVFSRLYVGLQTHRDGVPLGFATPYEENAAGRKRQETVNNWASGYGEWKDGKYIRNEPVTKIIENTPAPGFKITDDVKRVYWGGGNVVWRVEDPRGFELEIQSNNLMAIIQSAGVNEGGLIPGQCVWGRSGGDNILLHETSDEYKDAVKAAETLKAPKQVGKASRRVGGLYRCVDGSIGIFLGKLHVTQLQYQNTEDRPERAWAQLDDRKIVVSETLFDLNPSTEFEGVLSAEQGEGEEAKPGLSLKLYKKAPLVDDLGNVAVKVTDEFLLTLYWSFASSAISCRRIVSVTVDPIPNPVPALAPWTRKMFNDRMQQLKTFVKNNCSGGRMGSGCLLPLTSLLDSYNHDKVVEIDGVYCSAIATVGSPYTQRSSAQQKPTYHVGLPAGFSPGAICWREPTNDFSDALNPPSSLARFDRTIYRPDLQVALIKVPTFVQAEEMYAYIEALYNEGKLLYVSAKEAHV